MPEISDVFKFYMGLTTLLAMMVLSLVGIALSIRSLRAERRASEDPRFSDSDPLSLDQFYERYYAARSLSRTVVSDVVLRFAQVTRTPPRFLKPEDTFSTLGTADREECERFAVDTVLALQEAERRFGTSLFEGKLVTLDDYIRAFALAERLAAKSTATGTQSN